MESPDDYQAMEAVRFIAKKNNLTPEIYCASSEGITRALSAPAQPNVEQALREFGKELEKAKAAPKEKTKLKSALEEAPVNKIVAVIVRHAIEGLASDIHIEPNNQELRIRYRIDGQLHTTLLLSIKSHAAIVSRIKILSNIRLIKSSIPQEGRFFVTTKDDQSYSIKTAVIPTINGEKITLRLVDVSQPAPSLAELGAGKQHQQIISEHLIGKEGLFIIAGPDGSGKSTTLFSALTLLNKPDTNIVTIEDSIAFEIDGASQTQIRPSRGLSYNTALTHTLRQDTDIIMVDKMRDKETVQLLMQGALAGHLMLSTLYAKNALRCITHLLSLSVSPYLLASSLSLLVAQRLVPKLCQSCQQPKPISRELKPSVQVETKTIPRSYFNDANISQPKSFFECSGCPDCKERKVQGQIALFEIVPITKELRTAISNEADYESLKKIAQQKGFISMRQDGLLKALQGLVRYEDVIRVTD
jgi:type IV pilus assembly protein PilB